MNIGNRINARKIALSYIYWDLYFRYEYSESQEETNTNVFNTEIDTENAEVSEYLVSLGVDTEYQTEQSKYQDIPQGDYGLSKEEDDLAMISNGLGIDPLLVDREYVFAIIPHYTQNIDQSKELVDSYTTQFWRVDMDCLKKSIFILGYTEKQLMQTDDKVIINEMIELGKRFGWFETYKLINSVFHKFLIHKDKVKEEAK
jgi:transcription termination factor NusB